MKYVDIKNLTEEELVGKIDLEKSNYQKMKFAHAISPLENPSQIKEQKKLVARLNTESRARKN